MTDSPSRTPARPRRERVTRFLFALVDAPVVAAVAIGLAAALLHPRWFWWAQLVAIGLPYAASVLALTTLGAMLLRWRGLLVVHAVLLALVLVRADVPSRLASPTPGPDTLHLTTFNLPQTGPSQESLRDSAAAFAQSVAPDLLLLQDTWVSHELVNHEEAVHVAAILARAPYELAIPDTLQSLEERSRPEIGVPVLVRRGRGIEVVEQEGIVPDGGSDMSIALRSHLRWEGREFVLYNLHLRSFGPTKPWEDPEVIWNRPSTWGRYLRQYRRVYAQRASEAEQIGARIAEETLPVIVAGDFNSTADNWSARHLRHAGVRREDAFHHGAGLGWGGTYHAARPLVRIDHVYVDPAFEVASAHVMDVGFSDHRPVLTQLRWASDG
ncbi:MAG: endonuclease/exonuclease/phosphatase family protein [Bacteroidota bacterium]